MPSSTSVNVQQRGGEREMRCQGCSKWLDERDQSCGITQLCVNCCNLPIWMHSPAKTE